MTNEHKDALTGLCKVEIKRWKVASESNPNMRYMVELMEVALAALTAQPDEWQHSAEAAEAKLAELENQDPVADVVPWNHPNIPERTCDVNLRLLDIKPGPLFTRPAPAVSLATVSNCLSFFASVIKSGESWSETCQRDFDAARESLRNIKEAK